MVAKCVFDDVRDFAPKLRPAYDIYPTVVVVDPSTDKERQVSANDYFKWFAINWSWFNLAKMLARFTHHHFQAEFMQAFNEPNFQVSQVAFAVLDIELTKRSASTIPTAHPLLQASQDPRAQ